MNDKLKKKMAELKKVQEQKNKILKKEELLIQEIREIEMQELQKKLKEKNMSFDDLLLLISE